MNRVRGRIPDRGDGCDNSGDYGNDDGWQTEIDRRLDIVGEDSEAIGEEPGSWKQKLTERVSPCIDLPEAGQENWGRESFGEQKEGHLPRFLL